MKDQLEIQRHSCSHVLAAAILKLYPKTKLGIGPSIENGFYYDFDFPVSPAGGQKPIEEKDLEKITQEMGKIIKENLSFIKKEVSINEGRQIFKDQPYKLELINDLAKEGNKKVSIYKTGSFVDLCIGPHVENTSQIGPFKLLSIAGAYWRGSEKNKMLTRIYGTCFDNEKGLEKYLWQIEETKKRDHRTLGKNLDLFTIDDFVGPGLVLWHPKLSIVREEIENYWRKQHRKHGYQYVYTPNIGIDNLWITSGHLSFFKEGMFPPMKMKTKDKEEKTSYYVKPMNCPFHMRIYKSRPRSYRELPLRWCELGNVYRYEESGVLHGMLRVRGFTQDDAHIFCREDQFVEEVNNVLNFGLELNKDFGFDKLKVYLSTRDPENQGKYVGEKRIWEMAEKTLKEILDKRCIDYHEDVGGAKFYGPSIDLKVVDSLGREWQGTTIQLDMNEPAKFGITYIGEDGKKHIPVMLHRTLLGSMERFVATLIEQYAGAFPVWLSPVQVIVIPITDKQNNYGQEIIEKLREKNIRVELDDRSETTSAKIRDAELQKIPYLLVVGDKEIKENGVNVRVRGEKVLGLMNFDKFLALIQDDIDKKKQI